jgi:calcineurin-like phosphoesterase family protein
MLPDTPLIITPETWIISDTHFYHNNIGVVQPSRKLAGADHQELERLGCPA